MLPTTAPHPLTFAGAGQHCQLQLSAGRGSNAALPALVADAYAAVEALPEGTGAVASLFYDGPFDALSDALLTGTRDRAACSRAPGGQPPVGASADGQCGVLGAPPRGTPESLKSHHSLPPTLPLAQWWRTTGLRACLSQRRNACWRRSTCTRPSTSRSRHLHAISIIQARRARCLRGSCAQTTPTARFVS